MGKKHKAKKHKDRGYEDDYEEEKEKESLKIVFKLGGNKEQSPDVYSQSSHEEKRHKHKKKKKKKDRSKHAEDGRVAELKDEEDDDDYSVSQEEDDEDNYEPPVKRPDLDLDEDSNMSQELRPRRLRSVDKVPNDERGILKESLLYIQKKLQVKDVNGFFAFPVNDTIAPGYSSIILNPMDFSTMESKIENDQYASILDYKKDFVQMCKNAMTYNRPETIYYKEAKRLLQSGMKLLSKDKLISMKKNLAIMCSLTMDELGVTKQDETNAVVETLNAKDLTYQKKAKERDSIGRFEAFQDNLTPEEILAQAKAMAHEAAEMLTFRAPKAKLSFLNRKEDGTTSLCVLNSDNDGVVSETEKVISLGSLVGKLSSGTGTLAGFKEDKRNKVSQINYLNYGPFSSHAPLYDSSFSNVSKDESDLLLSTYGDESGAQYAQSLTKFVEDADDDCVRIVDGLLDVLTKGQHTITKKQINMKKMEEEMKAAQAAKEAEEGVQSTSQNPSVPEDDIQKRLNRTAELLRDLQQTQYERLSQKPPSHLSNILGPSDKEFKIANKVTSELSHLAKDTLPQNVASLQGIRSAMGIKAEPIIVSGDESQPIEIEENNDSQSDEFIPTQGDQTDQFDNLIQEDTCQSFDDASYMDTDEPEIGNL